MAKYIIYKGLNPKYYTKKKSKHQKLPQRKTTSTLKMPKPLTTTPQKANTANTDQFGTR